MSLTVEPLPVQLSAWGCNLMARTNVGQWTSCPTEPTHAVVDGGYRLFLCHDHARRYPKARPMSDEDRAELAGRQVQTLAGMAGRRFEPVGTVGRDEPEGL
jgi:hypothetical protein